MKELDQTDLTQETGNCVQTCVAMLLDLPLRAVPNFNDGTKGTIKRLEDWLVARGLGLMSARPDEFRGTLNVYGFAGVGSTYYSHGLHAVIWRMERRGEYPVLVWDPNPETRRGRYNKLVGAIRLYVIVPHPQYYPLMDVAQLDLEPTVWRCPNEECRGYLPVNCKREDCPRRDEQGNIRPL